MTTQKDTIFSNVAVLIYVFDITSTEWETDLKYFDEILTALRENSTDAGVWVLFNKMDLVDMEDPKRTRYAERKAEITKTDERIIAEVGEDNAKGKKGRLRCFPTSIWDESLYKVGRTRTAVTETETGLVVRHPHPDTQH